MFSVFWAWKRASRVSVARGRDREVRQVRPAVLVVDDERAVGDFFRCLLEEKGCAVETVASGAEARKLFAKRRFHLAIFDLKLKDADGLVLLREIKSIQPRCEVVVISGYSTVKSAVQAMKMGAFDYIEKPFGELSELEEVLARALAKAAGEEAFPGEHRDVLASLGLIVGNNREFQQILAVAEKLAKKNINILLQGETGTGKEIVARFIHAVSPRAKRPFLAVNCSALPESLLESELFGHEKGAFTGASRTKRGIFELADGGTLFLDEVGDASPGIQAKLLRVLETGEFFRVGGEQVRKTDVRVIAATNVDLEQAVAEKKFREDLFWRLSAAVLELPPLRERREDIPLLVDHFLEKYAEGKRLRVAPQVMRLLQEYSWPGNIRELANCIERAVALTDGEVILPEVLPQKILAKEGSSSRSLPRGFWWEGPANGDLPRFLQVLLQGKEHLEKLSPEQLREAHSLAEQLVLVLRERLYREGLSGAAPVTLAEAERRAIEEALSFAGGQVSKAARYLGISRTCLYRKLEALGLRTKKGRRPVKV